MTKEKRKICVVVHSRANYARIKSVMQAIKDHPDLELMLFLGSSALLYRFGNVQEVIREDGFEPTATIHNILEGENPTTMAKSTGLAIIELAGLFENFKPDIVLTVADRFETLATAVAASYMNIPLAHTQGGETTGSIDESVRHAITKLSHLHFPATNQAKEFVLRMGEQTDSVKMCGCPSIDLLNNLDLILSEDFFTSHGGVGAELDINEPYLVVLQHPVTTEFGQGFDQINETLTAVAKMSMQTVWLWPNVDAGSEDISKGIRVFRETNPDAKVRFYKHLPAEDFATLSYNASCLIGNSSSALREGAFLGVPAVNVGSRQNGREHSSNVVHAPYKAETIERCIRSQIDHGRYPRSTLFGNGNAGKLIADVLATQEIRIQKELSYISS